MGKTPIKKRINLARWKECNERHARGESVSQIARSLGISTPTVSSYLEAESRNQYQSNKFNKPEYMRGILAQCKKHGDVRIKAEEEGVPYYQLAYYRTPEMTAALRMARFQRDQQIYNMRKDGYQFATIAERFGISKTTARVFMENHARKYGLPIPCFRTHGRR